MSASSSVIQEAVCPGENSCGLDLRTPYATLCRQKEY
jgi:hypothetical protein